MDGGQHLPLETSPDAAMPARRIAGIAVADITGADAIRRLDAALSSESGDDAPA